MKFTRALPLLPGFALAALVYVLFNEARFGTIFDTGMRWYYDPSGTSGHFGFRYFPGNFYTLFFMAPQIHDQFPYIRPVAGGQSILTTSPAFLLALRTKNYPIAAAAILAALPVLFYAGNGMSQFGTRHYVDVFPFLLVLMARPKLDQMGKILIAVSIALQVAGVYSIRKFGL